MKRYVIFGAAIGFIIPLAYWADYYLSGYRHLFDNDTVTLWPSSILLMATDGHEGSVGSLLVCGLSVILNILLYSAIGMGVYILTRLFRQSK